MSNAVAPFPATSSADRRPRVWPGIVIVLFYFAIIKVPVWVAPGMIEAFYASGMGSMVAVLLFAIWWLFFSRLRWIDRILGLLACVAIGAAAWNWLDPSWHSKKADEPPDEQAMRVIFSLTFHMLPVVTTGCAVWMLIARSLSRSVRMAGLVAVLAGTWGYFDTLRIDGVTGSFQPEYSWRWNPTAESRMLAARASGKLTAGSVADAAGARPLELTPADWPAFRGAARDGVRTGVRIATDWKQHQPKELWRHPVGPGWSSFAVVGLRLFTQEQLGDDERVVCYDADTGAEVWAHTDRTRFDEAMGGPGPRATPTFHEGRIFALGANGRLNCLDAATGKMIWSHDIVADSGRNVAPTSLDPTVPIWGFAASPLVAHGLVTVFAGGPNGKAVLAYRADSGDLAWASGDGTNTYCSMQTATLAGVEQLVVATGEGMLSLDPVSGKVLWTYEWDLGKQFNRVVQPTVVGDADLLLGSGFGKGAHRVRIRREGSDWKAEKVWESRAISPYYNDLVVYQGHLYGFHADFFVCVNLETGKETWRERGYANGQVLLLADQGLLLILTESGEVALVEAKPQARTELGRFKAFAGKTWNHPVVANGKLYVRNGEEMACYQLAEPSGAAGPK